MCPNLAQMIADFDRVIANAAIERYITPANAGSWRCTAEPVESTQRAHLTMELSVLVSARSLLPQTES